MQSLGEFSSLWPALPEGVLALGALLLLMLGAVRGERAASLITGLSVGLLIVAALIVESLPDERIIIFSGGFVFDGFARFVKFASFIASAVAIVLGRTYFREIKVVHFEYPILIVLASVGMGMMISANDLLAVYVGLELMSLSLYVIAAIDRDNVRSSEAGLKYFVLGALSSGILLFGASLVYGFAGTTAFEGIAAAVSQGARPPLGLVFGLVFLIAGFAFKVSAVPFHMWTPDVYQGAPTPVAAFFSAAPKFAAMALFTRVMIGAFPNAISAWQQVVVFIAIASMLLGAFAAIGQSNIKRLLAYSSIANMGFALVGLASATSAGIEGVLIYMLIYLFMTLGVFACVLAMRGPHGMIENVEDLAGLSKTNPMMAFILAMMMFSLIGVPPLAGFFGKYLVFLAAIEAKLYALSIIGVLSSAVGAYYYLRIIKIMYFDEAKQLLGPVPAEVKLVLGVSGAFVLLFVLYPGPLYSAASAAAKSLF